ncbi:M3 family metallopeptidase [Nesterenkonia sp. HG001]|uniref:M3 family metallopeptidase n=1 Tax=Nesterenkonia sp. HG001 TaxID=2983207 RepID=UPI002AC557AD|nr:M3 family metallopeptidase [Nesterenkonia sp. HG001]MDZ5078419.1 M3 family metallopeptidase [Nesterenkonia sp. HG001]
MSHTASPGSPPTERTADAAPQASSSGDPFGEGFLLEHQHPDLRRVSSTDWLPALRAGMADARRDLDQVADDDAPADAENTLRAIGRAGRRLTRVHRAFSCRFSADGTDELQQVQAEIAPELAAHRDWFQLHAGLHRRLQELAERAASGETALSEEQSRMLGQLLAEAQAAGAGLDADARSELRALNRGLAEEESAYQRLQRREAEESAVLVTDPAALAGLEGAPRSSAAEAARDAGHAEGHLLRLSMPVQQPLLAFLEDRDTRRRLHEASVSRGTLPGEDGRTTRQIGARIAVLRARRARLLGHAHHLDAVLPLRTAPDRRGIEEMLRPLAEGGLQRLAAELAAVESHLHAAGEVDGALQPWDISYGLAVVARARAARTEPVGDRDDGSLPLEIALSRVFEAARRVYGLQVLEREDLPPFVEGARSFEVRESDGAVLGLFLLDLHSRPTKAGGAWMNSFSVASTLTGARPVVINCLNLARPAAGDLPRVTRAEQRTLFHEFGHALHGLLAEAEFEELSGTAVPRDNVEFPSQVNEVFAELWRHSPGDARHHEEGGVPGRDDREDIRLWGRGMKTVEHVAAVVLDLAWHTMSVEQAEEAAEDPEGFERRALAAWGLDHPLVPPRYGTGFFKHIFAGSGYAAGYYSYLWAEVLAADAADWFRELMGDETALARAGQHFRREVLSRGNTRAPEESFRRAVGHAPSITPMLRSLGMDVPA